MQHQFKAGDLALIINSGAPENIGKTVRLVEFIAAHGEPFVSEGVHFEPRKQDTWIVESPDGSKTLTGGYFGAMRKVRSGPCREKWLMPLKGDQSPAQTNTETPKEVVHG